MRPLTLLTFLALGFYATTVFSSPVLNAKIDKYLVKTRQKRGADGDRKYSALSQYNCFLVLKHAKQHIYKSIDQIFQLIHECKDRGIAAAECEMDVIAKVGKDQEEFNLNQERHGKQEPTNDPNQQRQHLNNSYSHQNQQIGYPNQLSDPIQNGRETRVEYAERPGPRITDNAQDLIRPWSPQQPSKRPPIPSSSNTAHQQKQSSNNDRRPFLASDPDAFMRRDQQQMPYYRDQQPAYDPNKPQLAIDPGFCGQNPSRPGQVPYSSPPQQREDQYPNDPIRHQIASDSTEPTMGGNAYSGYQSTSPGGQESLAEPRLPQQIYYGYGQPRIASGHNEAFIDPMNQRYVPIPGQIPQYSSPGAQPRYEDKGYHYISGFTYHESIPGSSGQEQPNARLGTEPRFESVGSSESPPFKRTAVHPGQEQQPRRPSVEPRSESTYVSAYDGSSANGYQRPVKLPSQNLMDGSNSQDNHRVPFTTPGVQEGSSPTNLGARPHEASKVSVLPVKDQSSGKPNTDLKLDIWRSSDGILNIRTGGKVYQIDPSKIFRARTGYSESILDEDLRVGVPDISSKYSPPMGNTKESSNHDESSRGELKSSQKRVNVESDSAAHANESADPDSTRSEEEEGFEADSSGTSAIRSAENKDELHKFDKEVQVNSDGDIQSEEKTDI